MKILDKKVKSTQTISYVFGSTMLTVVYPDGKIKDIDMDTQKVTSFNNKKDYRDYSGMYPEEADKISTLLDDEEYTEAVIALTKHFKGCEIYYMDM